MIDLHKQGHRQGPGGDAETELVLSLAMLDRTKELKVADIGCGTGASTLVLAKIKVLEKRGYALVGYFVLPEHCWLDEYYRPMQAGFEVFLNRNGNSEEAHAIMTAEQQEIDLYESYKAYISYGVYVAKKSH